MNIGELGNFISYAFAPASVVAPLGTVRLTSSAPSDINTRKSSVRSHRQLLLRTSNAARKVSQGEHLQLVLFCMLIVGQRDLVGVCIAIIGAVTVVLASDASDTRLDADNLLHAILQIPFLVFSVIYAVGVIILAGLSESRLGGRFVVIDVGLCALFGMSQNLA